MKEEQEPIIVTWWVCDGICYTLLSEAEAHQRRLLDYQGRRVKIWKELIFLPR